MAKKLEVIRNYLIITDTITLETVEYPQDRVRYKDYNNTIQFKYIDDSSQNKEYQFSDLVDKDEVSWTDLPTLLDWLRDNSGGAGTLDVKIQDQTTPVIILPMALENVRTTITVEAVVGERTFTVSDDTGFTIGHHFRLVDVNSDKFYYATILNVAANVVTVDTPIDFPYAIGSQAVDAITNMAVDGSITPVVFKHRLGMPSTPSDTDITRIIITCTTNGGIDLSGFGDGDALDNGLVFRQIRDLTNNIFNVKTNADISNIAYDFNIYDTTNPAQGLDGFVSRLTFAGQNKIGVSLRVGQDDNLEVIIQDDLTGLNSLSIIAEGHKVEA